MAQLSRPISPARRIRPTGRSPFTRRRRSRLHRRRRQVADKSLIFIATGDNTTSEVRFVSADDPSQPLTLISGRKTNREYHVDAAHGKLWILHQRRPCELPPCRSGRGKAGRMAHGHRRIGRVYLTGVTSYRDHLAVSSRVDGLDQLVLRTTRARRPASPSRKRATAPASSAIRNSRPTAYRLGYSSMVTPMTIYDYHPGRAASSRSGRSRKFRRATMPRNMRPSG